MTGKLIAITTAFAALMYDKDSIIPGPNNEIIHYTDYLYGDQLVCDHWLAAYFPVEFATIMPFTIIEITIG